MLKDILAGLGQQQQQPGQQMAMPQMPMVQQPQMAPQLDPYGQQMSGIRAALMGRMFNGF